MNAPNRPRVAPGRPYFWWILPLLGLLFLLSAPKNQAEEKSVHRPDLSKAGQAFFRSEGFAAFQDYCMLCHGRDGRGEGSAAKFLRNPPKDLTLISARRGGEFPFDEVYRIIDGREGAGHGAREMPIWGRLLSDLEPGPDREDAITREIQGLVFYLESIQQPAKE